MGRFLERLEAASGEGSSDSASDGGGKGGGKGEGGAPAALDVHALLGRMTMEVIGRSAFG